MQATQKREPSGTPRRPRARKLSVESLVQAAREQQGNSVAPHKLNGDAVCVPAIVTSRRIEALEAEMTSKQILLARIMGNEHRPVSKVEAFRFVYDYTGEDTDRSVYAMAYDCCNKPVVVQLAQAIKDEGRRQISAALESRDDLRRQIAAGLLDLAQTATDPKVRLAALKTLGETVHARSFARAEPDEATQAAGDLAGELLSKLRNLVADRAPTVDIMPQLDGEPSE